MPRHRHAPTALITFPSSPASDWLEASWSAQEAECRRLSTALHDDVATLLSATRLRFSQLSSHLPRNSDEASTAQNVSALLEEAIRNVRRLTQSLLPATLEALGLVAALTDYIGLLEQEDDCPAIVLRTEGLGSRLPYDLELTAFRVVQELVRNTLRHASAATIEVYVLQQKDRLLLTVSDDGVGFRASSRAIRPGLGLKNIESRLNVIGGRLIFDLTPGQGVCVLADIPLIVRPTPTS